MDMRALQTPLVAAIGVLWAIMTVLAGLGHWFIGLFVLLVMLLLFLVLGASRNGRLDPMLALCMVGFVVTWALAFGLAEFHANRELDWTLLGFHPSFGWIVLLYWLVGTGLLAFGYVGLRHRWLSQADWQAFLEDIQGMEGRHEP
jgi:hypothetical protein